ncbi:MAG: hypothetical protein QM537_03485 [Candidatus Symbiobacter sp.]|nr:hypothetical protein [Candidatus Symbiobacter sp.]
MVNPFGLFGGQGYVRKITTRTVLNPLIWVSIPIFTVSAICVLFAPDLLTKLVFLGIIVALLLAIFVAFFYFAIKDPDRLQSRRTRLLP